MAWYSSKSQKQYNHHVSSITVKLLVCYRVECSKANRIHRWRRRPHPKLKHVVSTTSRQSLQVDPTTSQRCMPNATTQRRRFVTSLQAGRWQRWGTSPPRANRVLRMCRRTGWYCTLARQGLWYWWQSRHTVALSTGRIKQEVTTKYMQRKHILGPWFSF